MNEVDAAVLLAAGGLGLPQNASLSLVGSDPILGSRHHIGEAAAAVSRWRATDLEKALAGAGLCGAVGRSGGVGNSWRSRSRASLWPRARRTRRRSRPRQRKPHRGPECVGEGEASRRAPVGQLTVGTVLAPVRALAPLTPDSSVRCPTMALPLPTEIVNDTDFGLQIRPTEPRLPGDELHHELASIRSAHRLAPVRFGDFVMYLITGHDDLEAAFRDDEGLPAGPTYAMTVEPCQGVTFESLDGPEHHVLRDLSTREMRSRPIARYREASLGPLVHAVIDRFADRGSADLVTEFTAVFPFLVFADRMGLPLDAADRFMDWAFDILGYPLDPERGMTSAAELTSYLDPVLARRRECPLDDQLSSMVTSEHDGRSLTDDEIRSHVRALFAAGATTTYHGLGNTLYAVLSHEGAPDRLGQDPSLIPAAVDEMLRWEPPLSLLPRLAPMDVEVAGHDVPAGTMLLFGIASANRDPSVHDEPDEFRPDRPMPRVLTFGLGSHYCPGSHLARAQISVAVEALLDRLDGIRLTDPLAARPSGTVLRGPASLEVTWSAVTS